MTIMTPVSDSDLRKAIELKMSDCCDCYVALSIAVAFGGSRSKAWDIARSNRFPELVADALDRGLDVASFRSAVDEKKFIDCCQYLKLREEIGGRADFPK